ncbi:MAG: SRPBCC family protein [Kineosporiaceae bacterium]
MNLGDAVTMDMAATPDQVWAIVSDITRIGELSPETFEAEWLDGATGPAPGARFRGHVKRNGRGPIYWTTCRVTACEPGRRFGFDVLGPGDVVANSWRYDIEPSATGARVTESFQLPDTVWTRVYWTLAGRWRGRTNRRGMAQTLARVQALVEAGTL